MQPTRLLLALVLLSLVFGTLHRSWADPAAKPKSEDAREHLAQFNALIGGWKGVGQVKRNSTQGAWRENGDFVWKFDKSKTGIEYQVKDGKHIQRGVFGWDPKVERVTLTAEFADGKQRQYAGRFEKEVLVLESKPDADGLISRVTLTPLSDIRVLLLYEQRRESQSLYTRVGEVGYTREGARLAASDQTGPVCIVTGGAGTIKVSHKGETYYVCCTGCRDAFNDDPETFIAEYKAKLEERKNKKNNPQTR